MSFEDSILTALLFQCAVNVIVFIRLNRIEHPSRSRLRARWAKSPWLEPSTLKDIDFMTTTDKRHEERAREICRSLTERSFACRVAYVKSALASTEAELVARMMEPSVRMVDSAVGTKTRGAERVIAKKYFRAMLKACCTENNIPLPKSEDAA